jgi:hypothetical protein
MTRKERKERAAFIRGMKGVWTEEEMLAAHSKGKLYVNHMGQLVAADSFCCVFSCERIVNRFEF